MTRRAGAPACGSGPAGVLVQYTEEPKEAQRSRCASHAGWSRHWSRKFVHNPGLRQGEDHHAALCTNPLAFGADASFLG